ncbi:MAG TPA: hypothetical protein VNR51_09770 [Hyphomicrobium sp.]|nr:hypothetical protein [Hyphomicrobium sp.]
MKRALASVTAESHATAVSVARAEGEAAGAAAAYARMAVILADPRVRGREGAALSLACRSQQMTPIDVGELMGELAMSGDSAICSLEQRMQGADGAPIPVELSDLNADRPDFVAHMKKRHGIK